MKISIWFRGILGVGALLILGACSDVPINTPPALILGPYQIVVQPGDTIYGIASRYKVSLKALMKLNRLTSSHIQVGQVLLLPHEEKTADSSSSGGNPQDPIQITPLSPLSPPPYTPLNTSNSPVDAGIDQEIAAEQSPGQGGSGVPLMGGIASGAVAGGSALSTGGSSAVSSVPGGPQGPSSGGAEVADKMSKQMLTPNSSGLTWPVQGDVVKQFSATAGKRFDGIEIKGQAGNSVVAAQDGTVAICKENYQSLGNVVVVKGSDGTLTAYGHLSKISVQPQQAVKPGTVLGTIGRNNKVYFEYRKAAKVGDPLKPVNPLKFLGG